MPDNDSKRAFRSTLPLLLLLIAAVIIRSSPAPMRAVQSLFRFTPPMRVAIIIFCVFAIYWEVAGKNSKPAASSESRASRLFHLTAVNSGLLILILAVPGLTRRLLPGSPVIPSIGLAIELGGFALAVWARRTLGSNWSGEVRIATGHQLVRSGPYRRIRHPIYTALLTMYLGITMVSGQLHALLGWLIILLAYIRKIRLEEAALAGAFGEEFSSWQHDTWRLLPPIY
jgi:protein-S-isoprenylcysteine O-methyltransferase Ste14